MTLTLRYPNNFYLTLTALTEPLLLIVSFAPRFSKRVKARMKTRSSAV